MDYVFIWLKLLLVIFYLRHSDGFPDQCCGLNSEISRLERHVLKILTELECGNETVVRKCYVTGLQFELVTRSQMSLIGYYIFHVLQVG
jgi:hypothetical protein